MALERTATIHDLSTYRQTKAMSLPHRNNGQLPFRDRLAARTTSKLGTWTYIIIQMSAFVCYILWNSIPGVYHWDPYPYLYLNLLMGMIGAFAVPLVILSQKPQVAENHMAAMHTEHLVEHLAHVDEQVVRACVYFIQSQSATTTHHNRPTSLDTPSKP
jgi:uncharacterized membrane protein